MHEKYNNSIHTKIYNIHQTIQKVFVTKKLRANKKHQPAGLAGPVQKRQADRTGSGGEALPDRAGPGVRLGQAWAMGHRLGNGLEAHGFQKIEHIPIHSGKIGVGGGATPGTLTCPSECMKPRTQSCVLVLFTSFEQGQSARATRGPTGPSPA